MVLVVVLAGLVGGYLWIQYGGVVVAEGRVTVRVTRAWAGDPTVGADYLSGSLTGPQSSVPSLLHIDRHQAPSGVREGEVLDCAYLQRSAPIVDRVREPVLTDCRRVTG